ncbi:MAG: PDZ domain-containing protein [Candidatus Omnitrophica bacterium]|nr:hypothetical protein [bacterium]NUN97259.1 PDZ domain-containing protein [Candidatus Omnitrophota bacterium]
MSIRFSLPILLGLIALTSGAPLWAVTKVVSQGEVLLVRDEKGTQYGALRVEIIEPKKDRLVYRWLLPAEKAKSLATPDVRGGTMEVRQIRGRALVAFGPFVLEWHGGAGKKGLFSAHGNLGIQPMYVATSAIREPTRITDMVSGYAYEVATNREAPTPLGLVETLGDLPKARLGLAVEETLLLDENGIEIPSIRISRVDEESNAFSAGIREGQELVAINDREIYSAADFRGMISGIQVGEQVTLSVVENGEPKKIRFEAAARIASPGTRPAREIDPNLSPEERARLEKNQDVFEIMLESVEALRAIGYD